LNKDLWMWDCGLQNQPIRLPGLILRLRSGQAPGVCSGLILSGVFTPILKSGFGAVERINLNLAIPKVCGKNGIRTIEDITY
jgi:hypothetical protein